MLLNILQDKILSYHLLYFIYCIKSLVLVAFSCFLMTWRTSQRRFRVSGPYLSTIASLFGDGRTDDCLGRYLATAAVTQTLHSSGLSRE